MKKIAVIGSAGRNDDILELNHHLFENMRIKLKSIIEKDLKMSPSDVTLVSGGAAWVDHIAVVEYLSGKYGGLELHFPCKFIDGKYEDNGAYNWQNNPGKSANLYHKHFSTKIKHNSLEDIQNVIKDNNVNIYDHYNGFHERNKAVGKVDVLIAFTFSSTNKPKPGGTLHTWNCSNASKKIHVSLSSLK
jgi:1-aminocyclopropane-1-carboxylate deaminase/D-cysteine desulfhydrase-like pyridoxal-dependent ACC family enzyme